MLNNTTLQGRIVATPELKTTPTGLSVTNFTIAHDRGDKDKTTDFIDCFAWRKTAEHICRWFERGSMIIIIGKLQTRTWQDDSGKKRKIYEISVDGVEFCGGKVKDEPTEQQRANLDGLKSKAGLDVAVDDDPDALPF